MKLVSTMTVGLALALSMAAPAVAKPPPAGVWVDLHFAGPNGKTKTVVEQLQITRADLAEETCADQKGMASSGAFDLKYRPDLAGMSFVSGNCELDKTGHPKVAVGSWPGGFKPSVTKPIAPVDPYSIYSRNTDQPAVVEMTYKLITGATTSYDAAPSPGHDAYDMRTCPAKLASILPGLKEGLRYNDRFPGGTFISAKCKPIPGASKTH